jgi:hypothetical protein
VLRAPIIKLNLLLGACVQALILCTPSGKLAKVVIICFLKGRYSAGVTSVTAKDFAKTFKSKG